MKTVVTAVSIYLAVVSLISVITTVWDKRASKISGKRRVPERTLLVLSGLGGSVAMLLTMSAIRHKTKHPKFMIGIPAIIIAQLVAAFLLYSNLT